MTREIAVRNLGFDFEMATEALRRSLNRNDIASAKGVIPEVEATLGRLAAYLRDEPEQ
jgi:hypothetical protein